MFTSNFNGGRYVAKLPFKPHAELLPDNYNHSTKRLSVLRRKLGKDPILKEQYNSVISSYENEGIIEKVFTPGEPGRVFYLPHRAVVRNDKETTKCRVVFVGSAKEIGPSLNDNLYTGPCLLPNIFYILARFRFHKVGIVSDIRQAFLNIGIADEHRDYLRFLWRDQDDQSLTYRFCRVVFGINSSPFLLNATIQHQMGNYLTGNENITKQLIRDLYVDDSTTGVNSVEEGMSFYDFAKTSLKEGGFNLTKWYTNSPELMNYIVSRESGDNLEPEDELSDTTTLFPQNKDERKVLGVIWNGLSDEFIFKFEDLVANALTLPVSKRSVLSIGAQFYDPLGLISPIIIYTKTMFQKLCLDKVDWDAPIPEPNKTKWLNYLFKLKQLNSVSIPRYIVGSEYVTMHGFCDSSKEAYCAVVYLQAKNKEGIQSGIIASKTKVAPLKELSIPRLELLGCLMLATLVDSICKAIDGVMTTQTTCFWSDSKISLCWIKNNNKEWKPWVENNNKEWKPWVENRVNKIRDLSEKDDWYFVPGGINPADIATREIDILSFSENTSWWKGPDYILHDENTWPDQGQVEPSILDEVNTEMRVVQMNLVVTDTSEVENSEGDKSFTEVALHNIIDINRFSSLS